MILISVRLKVIATNACRDLPKCLQNVILIHECNFSRLLWNIAKSFKSYAFFVSDIDLRLKKVI